MRERPDAEARLWSEGVTCASACAYAILGAVTREIAAGARIGVHSSLVDPSRTETQRALMAAAAERGIRSYLADLGIDAELYKIAMATSFESMHVLTRSELYDLGIDRRETVDSGWTLGNVDSRKGFLVFDTADVKAASVGRDNPAMTFKRLSLAIACYRPRRGYIIAVSQPLPNASAKTMVDFRVSAGTVGVTLDGSKSTLTTKNNGVSQLWRELASKGVIETLLTSPTIKVAIRKRRGEARNPAADDPPPEFLFSNVRGAEALKAIVSHCADQK
jgi:hypothetical protein